MLDGLWELQMPGGVSPLSMVSLAALRSHIRRAWFVRYAALCYWGNHRLHTMPNNNKRKRPLPPFLNRCTYQTRGGSFQRLTRLLTSTATDFDFPALAKEI